jgi:hypothetical protein
MKRYILGQHLATWHKWKSVNGGLDSKDLHQEKSKKKLSLVMGPSQIILGMVICRRKMMHNNKKLWRM